MPIYEYQCTGCTKIYELIHKHDDVYNIVCDECLKPLIKLISTGGFRLYGQGFYKRTDKDQP